MAPYAIPDRTLREEIEDGTRAQANLCWNCSTCDSECPVYLATGRLRPQKIVRMANLGFFHDLLSLPEIWYCLTCRRCNYVCPNLVKPASIIGFLRQEAIRRKIVPWESFLRYRNFFGRFQRIRWRITEQCISDEVTPLSPEIWTQWLETPLDDSADSVPLSTLSPSRAFRAAGERAGSSACFTCGECGNACPIFFERPVFDPQWIFRMVNLGLEEEILKSPSIWLCLACQRCTEACGELVSGHLIIARIQELALEEGAVDEAFPFRLKKAQKTIYPLFVEQIDSLLGFSPPP
ncbi:MAG: 4Fe-4S dicluster domain-containing protein [Deltaproteobacteria bacterium]|nr:4Fe-4S dicluster domain-containing protein [Deltaproteobacteria bacterium]MBW2049524.1 4Fe-4S dicluster domain-containing protein [Deltaproteobacteria bacterium]MBW2110651.1 4Fe-4S dicluster domain-containing protein [Deltaproteobacteria bacterium]MBW2354303.1 4Fe-4S dicluster domain-containing protein [Deltaproteobacteria bacterium]